MKNISAGRACSLRNQLLVGGSLSAFVALLPTAAFAQANSNQVPLTAAQPAAAATSATSGSDVQNAAPAATGSAGGEIVVTAQKRSEKLQNVPISISAVTAAQLSQRNIAQVSQLSQSVPALRIDYSGNTIQPTIRGVGSEVAGPGFISNIPIYVDGFYIPSPTASDINLVDLESVNVLKGPQGTLFGYNATGGAIQINTKQPEQETSGLFRAGYGSYDHVSTAFYGTTGLTDTLAVSLGAAYEYGNGYIRNIVTGDKDAGQFRDYSFRPKLLWKPANGVSFLLAYSHSYTNDPTVNETVARDGHTIGSIVPGNVIATGRGEISNNAPDFMRLKSDSITLTSRADLGFADITSYTGYRKDSVSQGLEYDDTPANIYGAQWKIPDKTFTQEIDLSSKSGGRFNWVVGGFYMHLTDVYDYNTNTATSTRFDGGPYNPLFTSKNTLDSYAVFADGTYEIVDNLFLTAGGRYSIDHPKLAYDLFPADLIGGTKVSFHNFSARGVVRYQLNPQSNVYASFTQGYKAGTLPGSAFNNLPVKPEHIDAYEAGYKIANRILRFNVAGYYYNYRDIQVTSYGANGVSITRNAAAAHIYGVDGDLSLQLTRSFSINASAAYTHAKYSKFTNAIGFQQDLNPTSATYGQFNTITVDASGFSVARTPRFAGSIGGDYGMDLAGGRLALDANLFYTSHFYFDSVEELPQKHYILLNMKATWTDPSKKVDLSVYGTNVTSTKYLTQNFTDTFASRAVYGAPSEFGGSVTFHF